MFQKVYKPANELKRERGKGRGGEIRGGEKWGEWGKWGMGGGGGRGVVGNEFR